MRRPPRDGTPLSYRASNHDLPAFTILLLRQNVDINVADSGGRQLSSMRPRDLAVAQGDEDIVQMLLKSLQSTEHCGQSEVQSSRENDASV